MRIILIGQAEVQMWRKAGHGEKQTTAIATVWKLSVGGASAKQRNATTQEGYQQNTQTRDNMRQHAVEQSTVACSEEQGLRLRAVARAVA